MKAKTYVVHLDFMDVDFAIGIGDTLVAANKAVNKLFAKTNKVPSKSIPAGCDGCCIGHHDGCQTILLVREYVTAATIAHECLHATCAIFRNRGIVFSEDSEEAYTYHQDMLMRTVLDFCKQENIKVKLC